MLFKISMSNGGVAMHRRYVDAPDKESADLFAEDQAYSYGCKEWSCVDAFYSEINADDEVLRL